MQSLSAALIVFADQQPADYVNGVPMVAKRRALRLGAASLDAQGRGHRRAGGRCIQRARARGGRSSGGEVLPPPDDVPEGIRTQLRGYGTQ